jgi:preprotein translocase subunit SecE
MPIQEDIKPQRADEDDDAQETTESSADGTSPAPPGRHLQEGKSGVAPEESSADDGNEQEDDSPAEVSPTQLGAKRFVYAAYFAGGIAIAFIADKALGLAWYRLQTWKPAIGEARDEIILPISALIGAGAALYYWYRTRARQLAEEVAAEMSKVTWPSRTEVQNGTFVVVVTTIVSTVFFALMDRFWGFVTNLVYGGS